MSVNTMSKSETTNTSLSAEQIVQVIVYPVAAENQNVFKSSQLQAECVVLPLYTFKLTKGLSIEKLENWVNEILVDPIIEKALIASEQSQSLDELLTVFPNLNYVAQKNYLPGVTDNLARSIVDTIQVVDSSLNVDTPIALSTGELYLVSSTQSNLNSTDIAKALEHTAYNPLIQQLKVFDAQHWQTCTEKFYYPQVQLLDAVEAKPISLNISDAELLELSKARCLALTLDEMLTIKNYYLQPETELYRKQHQLPSEPTDVELEVLAQTWSEHCKHKIFNAEIHYEDRAFPEYGIVVDTIDSLFKTYISGPTKELLSKRKDLLSIFKDNAGIVQWNENTAVCFKVETHNSPSALEPYGGALTGILGVNRDILGTGLGAKPIANTDVFCFAHPEQRLIQHPKFLPAETICNGVRKGVEDGGNKSGIPTVNGALFFDPRYRAKPLVFCGTVGVMPLEVSGKPAYEKHTQVGDVIVSSGGRVGKDGIHGATFSSEALNEGSPASAVQIGDPLTQKRLLDFVLAARDKGLITGITDNGAGGLSSSVGEMAEFTNGAKLYLDKVPLKYQGLQPYEILVSESQERMTMSTNQPEALLELSKQFGVESTVVGEFTDTGFFEVYYKEECVANLSLEFLHHGLPKMKLNALWEPDKIEIIFGQPPVNPDEILLSLLAHPNICSREPLIRQYDHEVQARSVQKSLCGPLNIGPADAAVILPELNSKEALVISNGLAPKISGWDAYHMATCSVDEAVRNAVSVGCDPESITLLDNFCWPDPVESSRNWDGDHKLAQLVRACMGLKEIALCYETPFISGKDSMKNDFDDGQLRISIPPTLLISAMGKLPDANKAVSMPFKQSGDKIFILGQTQVQMGASFYYEHMGWQARYCPQVNLPANKRLYQSLHQAMMNQLVESCHDISDGGLSVALAECLIASNLGANITFTELVHDCPEVRWDELLFSESPGRFVVSVKAENVAEFKKQLEGSHCILLGEVTQSPELICNTLQGPEFSVTVEQLKNAWLRSPLTCWNWDFEEGGSTNG